MEQKKGTRLRTIRKWARTLHLYLTMFAFALFLFYALTGFMLNHSEWFGIDRSSFESEDVEVPLEFCRGPDRQAILGLLRDEHGIASPLDGFEVDENEIHVIFKSPAHLIDAFIDRATGDMEIRTERGNLFRFLTDVHMGENTGTLGRRILDFTAILLFLAGLTGLLLTTALPKPRLPALIALLTAALLFLAFLASVRR